VMSNIDTTSTEWIKNVVYIPVDWEAIKKRKRCKEIQEMLNNWKKI